MSNMSSLSGQTFKKDVIESDLPVLVDFWAPWCGPCLMLSPVLEKISVKYQGKIKVLKLNVDEDRATAADYQIMSIPCLILFKKGMETGRIIGYMDESQMSAEIDALLSKA
jgi:thioredoxin 1